MEENKDQIHLHGLEGNVLTILHGEALTPKEPNRINIVGVISIVAAWLSLRISEIKQKHCYVLVNKDNRTIELVVNEHEYFNTTIKGKLELSKEFQSFGINSDRTWDTFSLSDFIKMNRSFFASKDIAAKLVTDLRNFKAKVNREIEKFKDDRANYDERLHQVVDSNLPETFDIVIPVFKGEPKKTLTIEICIDPRSLACSLVSPDASDYINEQTEVIINEQITKIHKIASEIIILHQ